MIALPSTTQLQHQYNKSMFLDDLDASQFMILRDINIKGKNNIVGITGTWWDKAY